ncbi:uncharacterized protein Dana_GF12272 [Drosophila ananassae]|uniref:Bleomycin hydrolase n=1 Tax=Drosophila ananassae TaxID=7217 RepID=B3MHJ6_DROAN|nr:bleomycin hydrolase [Drosophila ananassae]EDV35832.2 uncharacterized protein Dana_GF12272 [Drosophila ananassae]
MSTIGIDGPSAGMLFPLTDRQLSEWRFDFYGSPRNRLAQNVCTARNPINACLRSAAELSTVLDGDKKWYEVNATGKAATGGPGWICTGLDLLRLEFVKNFPVPVDFEFSTGHLVFWHKLERCNYFLCTASDLLERCEPLDGRNFRHLMKHAIPDGGNWQMFVNLVRKHGVMPKSCYLTSKPKSGAQLNKILRSKLHEYASLLHARYTFDGDGTQLPKLIGRMMARLYKVVTICLGEPPEEFHWTYYDQKKRFQSLQHLTALHFYEMMVAKYTNLTEFVCLGHDPRVSSGYHKNFEVAHSSNMVDGLTHRFNNQPMEVLLQILTDSLAGDKAVWLTCDLCPKFSARRETLSLIQKTHNFSVLFGLDVGNSFSKADRMVYKESRPDAALLLTAVGVNSINDPVEFRTISASVAGKTESTISLHEDGDDDVKEEKDKKDKEGDAVKKKAKKTKAATVDADWLREYGFEIVVHESFVPVGILNSSRFPKHTTLPPWDPMGSLLG